ncbi:hypothetical protein HDV02_000421 [Globomyces sp. JEL0801]|nr:hypothetical protein HDV02_000421 [Globomyces sp. JEL0801]
MHSSLFSNAFRFEKIRRFNSKWKDFKSKVRLLFAYQRYLGFKKLQGAKVIEGNIILRQRGRQWHPGTDVGIGKDHTLFALNKGRVVIHYDLARNRRFVSVDDGTLEPLPSRIEMKRKLRDMINVEEYLNLDAEGRYEYTMKQLKLLTSQMEKDRIAYKDSKLVDKERRVLGMVDMTML